MYVGSNDDDDYGVGCGGDSDIIIRVIHLFPTSFQPL